MQIYSLFDSKLGEFDTPMFFASEVQAKRGLSTLAYDTTQNTLIIRSHPNDFSLYLLGTYDRHGAVFHLLPQPQLVINLADLFSEVKNNG